MSWKKTNTDGNNYLLFFQENICCFKFSEINLKMLFPSSQLGLKRSPQLVLATDHYDVRTNVEKKKKVEPSSGQVLFKKQGEKVKQSSKNWS